MIENAKSQNLLARVFRRYRRWQADRAIAQVQTIAHGSTSSAEKFAQIYDKKLWAKAGAVNGEAESLSGHGSSLSSTAVLREELEQLFAESPPKTFFDAPCGDFNWMREVRFPEDCAYMGGDIVASVIETNRRLFASAVEDRHARSFRVFDITTDPFPVADYWLCKDCLQHLSLADVRRALQNFAASSVGIALISNHHGVAANTDIATGDFRHLDLTLAPFHLPKPSRLLRDSPIDNEPRSIAVWTRDEIAEALASTHA